MNKKRLLHLTSAFAMLLAVMAAQAQPAYFQAVTNLNPVAYWPMHEAEAAAHGDIETNFGSAGPQANGFYADWAAPSPTGSMIHNWPGAIAGDPDTAMNFNCIFATGSGAKASATNCLIIPHASPAAALVPPFTVELWYFETNNLNAGHQCDIFSSVNAGGTQPGLNGISTYSGIRLYLNNNLVIYTYNNNGGLNSVNSTTTVPFGGSTWTYLVVTDDGTNINAYQNGVAVITNWPNANYAPNYWDPLEVDTGKGFTRDASGYMDEIAIYPSALGSLDISNHYATGLNPAPATPYKTLVLNDNPSIYYRMDSPPYTIPAQSTLPGLTNYGSAAVNGFYEPGVAPGGVTGPNNGSQLAAGFGASDTAMPGNGMSSYADAGYAPAYNPTGTNAFSVSAWFKGGYCDSRTQTIVGHTASSYALVMTTTGHLQCQLGTNTASLITSAGVYNDSFWHQAVEVYTPNAIPTQPGTNALYVDGVLDIMTNTVTTNGLLPGASADVLIGSDPQYTNSPAGLGRQFAGNICEVALFAQALTAGQIQSLYNAGGLPPYISTQPVSATANQGGAFTNTIIAHGAQSLGYQWYTNGVALTGQTGASLVLNPVLGGEAGTNYYVVVTNSYGSVTSAVVSLSVNSSPSISAQFPVSYASPFTVYAGANPAFSVVAGGAQPIVYFWYTNGVLDAAATNSSLTLTNVQAGSLPNNYCVVSNFVGTATSTVWSATVVADPVNSGSGLAPYPQAVLALGPVGYWRLNEAEQGGGDAGVLALDYAGGNNGIYTNVVLGQSGYDPATDPTDTSVKVGSYATTYSFASQISSNIDFAAPAGVSAKFTVETWALVTTASTVTSPQGCGLVCKGAPNGGEEFALDITPGNFRFFVRSANGTQYSATAATATPLGAFSHLVGVCDEANSNVSLYVNGVLAGKTTIPPLSGINNGTAVPMTIGSRSPNAAAITEQAFGNINDVAVFNYALSSNQVANEYYQSGIAPFITQQPVAFTNASQGGTVVVPVGVNGTTNLVCQWFDVNAGNAPLAGQTNATLVISSIQASDSYYLTVNNAYGSTNSATVTVYVGAAIISKYPVGTNVLLYAGGSASFSVVAEGAPTLHYYWLANGTVISGAATASYTLSNAQTGGPTNIACLVSNTFGMATNAWAVTIVPNPTAPYPAAVVAAHPVGYWPLNEGPDNGNGDDGVIANDYVGGNDGFYTNVVLGNPGYNPTADPTATSVAFGTEVFNGSDVQGIPTTVDFSAPSGSASSFSVEAWVQGYQQNSDAGIVSKGYGGGGEQFDLDCGADTVNTTNLYTHSYRFLVRDASGNSYAVSSTVNPIDQTWHHLVGVCNQAGGELTFYIDGVSAGSSPIPATAGILTSTRSMLIGSRPSNQSTNVNDSQFAGYIQDVAVYNYALTASQVLGQYQLATGTTPATPTLSITNLAGGNVQLSWSAGTLQSSTNLTGAFTDLPGVTSPHIVPATNAQVFFRVHNP